MAKRRPRKVKKARKPARPRRTKAAKRPRKAVKPARKAPKARATSRRRKAAPRKTTRQAASEPRRATRLDRERRTLEDTVPTPPSSLNLNRRGSAARTGRAELRDNLSKRTGMTPAIAAGDVDVNLDNAYFSGDEAPGGDNPTPDQDVVEEIGRALGVEYHDNEELRGGEELSRRDKKRWELDPASSEDYRDRDKE